MMSEASSDQKPMTLDSSASDGDSSVMRGISTADTNSITSSPISSGQQQQLLQQEQQQQQKSSQSTTNSSFASLPNISGSYNVGNSNSNNINSNNRFSIGSIKLMIESAEIGKLTDEAALYMSNQVTQKLRKIINEAEKFCFHSRRKTLMTRDIDHALKVMNMQPVWGFYCKDVIPFRFAFGGGHKFFYHEDKEIELADVIARVNIPKLPQEVSIESHWLAIDGVQPAIPENPPPLTRDEQKLECVDPLESLNNRIPGLGVRGDHLYPSNISGVEIGADGRSRWIDSRNNKSNWKPHMVGSANINVLKKHIETVQVKQLATHELSVEQQLYYKEITEACVGSIEQKRCQALNSLSHDPGLHQMLPRLCTFISEGVKVNVVHNNLALLIYLMRMVKALLENQTLYLEKYLHDLCPTVITCIVSKQICNRPEQDNHYALRDFASKLLANICKTYNTSTNCLQTRTTRLLCKALDNPNLPLSSVYGCISALCELGTEVQQVLLVGRLRMIHDRLKPSSPDAAPARGSPEGRIISLLAKYDHHLTNEPDKSRTMTTT